MENIEKYLNKFYDFIDKIGKHNFILIIFIFIVLLTTTLYQTFSIYTESEGLSIIDGIETYSFILNNSNTTNSVTIAAGNSKNIDITITNETEINLKYGLYYSATFSLEEVALGYNPSTTYLPNGIISADNSYVVSIKVDNNSLNNITINFGIKYGFENSNDLILGENENWLSEYVPLPDFEINNSISYLSSLDNLDTVPLTLVGDDDYKMCISVDNSECTNYVDFNDTYNLDFSTLDDGEKTVYVYYKNSNDEIVASMNKTIILDTTPPTNNSIVISEGTTATRTLTLSSTNANQMCFSNTSDNSSDCTNWIPYETSTSWDLTAGSGTKIVYAFFKDEYGNISEPISTTTFVLDNTGEDTQNTG